MRTPSILDLSRAPKDSVERIAYLDTVLAKAREEVEEALAAAYFDARLEGRFEAAVDIGKSSRKRALMFTRRRNSATGRAVRWNDGLDPTSTKYAG
jgi:hypothetical protein